MAAPEKEEESTEPVAEVRPEGQENNDPAVHRPDEEIANRPQLKVRPIGSRPGTDSPKPTVRGGTLFRSADKPPDARASEAKPTDAVREDAAPRKAAPAPQETAEVRFPYATHRPAPPDEKAEKAELAALTGAKAEREIPTGLVLGLALIVVALVGGVFTVRLSKKVGALEQRLTRLERPEARATVTNPQAPAAGTLPAAKSGTREARPRTVSVAHVH
jgi:hypothetical protein